MEVLTERIPDRYENLRNLYEGLDVDLDFLPQRTLDANIAG